LAWTDAIALSNALNTPDISPVQPTIAARVVTAAALARQVRADLSQAIRNEPAFRDVQPDAAGLSALRGHLRLHQRAMAARIPLLRAQLRQALAAQGPAAAQLASLDAVLEQALAARERQLLDTLPTRLTKALTLALNQAPAQAQTQTQTQAQTQIQTQTQALLLAELAHRLQPVDGLLQALGQAHTGAA